MKRGDIPLPKHGQPDRYCMCDLRTRLVGDGCSVCNPEFWAELLAEDTSLPLKEGSRLDLNQPWEVPQQQEK